MAQKDAFKVTAVTAKAKELSMNLEKIMGARKEEEHVVYLGQHNYTLMGYLEPTMLFYHY